MKSKQQKTEQSIKRQHNRAALSDAQQIARLDKRLGKDVGAKKERARLLNRIVVSIVG